MTRLVSWPMYAVDPAAVAGFWRHLRQALVMAGIDDIPDTLSITDDLAAHWRDPTLLLSQTCGFPFVTSLSGRVRYVATPCFAIAGCERGFYRSAVVVRRNEPARSLAAMAGRRVAFNSSDSQSGYNALRTLVAPLAAGKPFFSGTLQTGAHRLSMRAVVAGAADVAAIDVVTLAMLGDHAPEEVAGLRVLCHTASAPGLPLITAADTSDADLARLRQAVDAACRSDTIAARALRLDGAVVLPIMRYDAILAQRDAARAFGYPDLT